MSCPDIDRLRVPVKVCTHISVSNKESEPAPVMWNLLVKKEILV